ncbi:MAG: phosphotransferase [Caldilineaceae bacterium]|nr:phosphotransferase [Caldilineaceae bacterium]
MEAELPAAMSLGFAKLADAAESTARDLLPDWEETAPTPVHGDLRAENCLTSFGQVGLLDWEMFGLGDPALDAATFLHWNGQLVTGEGADSWLDIYLTSFDHPGMETRIALYRCLLPLRDLCFLLDGVIRWRQMPASADAVGDNLAYLQATLTAAWQRAAAALGVQDEQLDATVYSLFDLRTEQR